MKHEARCASLLRQILLFVYLFDSDNTNRFADQHGQTKLAKHKVEKAIYS